MGTHIDSFYLRHLACTPQTGKLIGCIYRLFRLFAARHWTMCRAQQFQRQIHFWAGNIANFVLADEFIGFFPTKLAETRKTINQWEVGVKPKKKRISSQQLDDSLAKNHPKHGFVWKYDTHWYPQKLLLTVDHHSPTHRIHGAAIYDDIYHQYTPVMLAYIPAPWIRHGL